MILNVNVPDLPYEALQRIRGDAARPSAPRQARGARARSAWPRDFLDRRRGPGQDAGPGTDFHAVANGFVSVTPLQVDLTRHAALESVREWLREPAA